MRLFLTNNNNNDDDDDDDDREKRRVHQRPGYFVCGIFKVYGWI